MNEPGHDYHISASSHLTDDRMRVLKHRELFAVFDRLGEIAATRLRAETAAGVHGLYLADMRHLSRLEMRIGGARPLLLSSMVKEDNALLTVDLTNPDLDLDGTAIKSDTIHILRSKFLLDEVCYEEIRLRNYGERALRFPLRLHFAADFADIFEIRGLPRKQRGTLAPAHVGRHHVRFLYYGLDGLVRQTSLYFRPLPVELEDGHALFDVHLAPGWDLTIGIDVVSSLRHPHEVSSADEPAPPTPPERPAPIIVHHDKVIDYPQALIKLTTQNQIARSQICDVQTSNELFNHWIARSVADIYMLTSQTEFGPYPYAGTPWYSTVFGRDGLITAYQCLWILPEMARGVLGFLAAHQAEILDNEADAEPGKILHEMRKSEMALVGEVPFRHYYGSIDSTLLFLLLADAYFQRTADQAFIEDLWPNIERALHWLEQYGDRNKDGFVEYDRRTPEGLAQQGWKDSEDSVFHEDGEPASPPIALCEVQAYAYGARQAVANLAEIMGRSELAREQREKAEDLRLRFEEAFWCEDLGVYALALDGAHRPCRVRTSNAGQCLLTQIASPARARTLHAVLGSDDFYSGWGIRTVAMNEARFNPLSYHNGSVWPHDNALIALGLSRYGLRELPLRLLEDLFRASRYFDLHRIPELYCGFERRPGEGPTLYPVACSPQAWAAGSLFMLLQAVLGLSIDAGRRLVSFENPILPPSVQTIELRQLRVGDARVSVRIKQHLDDTAVEVLERDGDVRVLIAK
jgi:glycogen debranching enzyme